MWEQLTLPDPLLLHPRVQAVAEISRLRTEGYSANAIARSLNRRGVPTPSGRGQWWPSTVQYHGYPGVRAARDAYIARYRAEHR